MCNSEHVLPTLPSAEMSAREQRELLITQVTGQIVCCALESWPGSGGPGGPTIDPENIASLIQAIKNALRDGELG